MAKKTESLFEKTRKLGGIKPQFSRNFWLNGVIFLVVIVVAVFAYSLIRRTIISPPVSATIEKADNWARVGEQIQINVLNGSGQTGVSRKTMDFMRSRGFDVVEIDNYEHSKVDRTFVIDRVGDSLSTKKVAYALGIPDSLCVKKIDSTLYLRCSVVLGKDYPTLKAFQK